MARRDNELGREMVSPPAHCSLNPCGRPIPSRETAEALLPGLRVYWPLVTEVDVIPTARQTHNLPTQALTTSDGKKVVVSGVVVYRIKDIVATMARNWDVSDTLNDISMVAITKIITTHTFEYLLQQSDG